MTVFIRQTGIGVDRDMAGGQLRQGPQVVSHELRAGGTVQADAGQAQVFFQMGEGGIECLYVLACQHGAGGLNGAGYHYRYPLTGLFKSQSDPFGCSLQVQGILGSLKQQQIHATSQQADGLISEGSNQLFKGYPAGYRNSAGGGTHGTGYKAGFVQCAVAVTGPACHHGRGLVQLKHLVGQAILSQHDVG